MNESFDTSTSNLEKYKISLASLRERREIIFRNKELEDGEIIDQMQEIDQLIVSTELNYSSEDKHSADKGLSETESRLLEVASGDFYTEIQPETSVYHKVGGKGFEEENALCLTLDSMNVMDDGRVRFSVRVTEPYKKGDFHVEHAGIIEVDVTNNQVRAIFAPEGIAIERPRTLRPEYSQLGLLTQNAIHALTNLIEPAQHNPSLYKEGDGQVGSGNGTEERLTKIELEKLSVLKCRKRTFHRLEDLDTLFEKLDSLENSWSEQERALLTKVEGDNKIHFKIFVRGLDGQYTEMEDQPTMQDAVSIQAKLESLFASKTIEDATVVCKGTWVDRYLRNLEPAPSPTAHTRRLRGKVILVLPQNTDDELRNLQGKIKSNGIRSLNEDEKEQLKTILATDEEGLISVFSKDGVIYKSDTFSSGTLVGNPKMQNRYYYSNGINQDQNERDAA